MTRPAGNTHEGKIAHWPQYSPNIDGDAGVTYREWLIGTIVGGLALADCEQYEPAIVQRAFRLADEVIQRLASGQ